MKKDHIYPSELKDAHQIYTYNVIAFSCALNIFVHVLHINPSNAGKPFHILTAKAYDILSNVFLNLTYC